MFRIIALIIGSLAVVVALGVTAKASAATGQASFNGAAYCAPNEVPALPRIAGYPTGMRTTPGFASQWSTGGSGDFFVPSASNVATYSPQFLKFRVVAWYQDSRNNWYRLNGKWLGGYGELGPHTSGLFMWIEMSPNNWVPTGQVGSSSPEDMSWITLPGHGWYYRQIEFVWGPIYNTQTGQLAYAGDSAILNFTQPWIYC